MSWESFDKQDAILCMVSSQVGNFYQTCTSRPPDRRVSDIQGDFDLVNLDGLGILIDFSSLSS